jgi:hypothetical protein
MVIIVDMVIAVYIKFRALPSISMQGHKNLRSPCPSVLESPGSIGEFDPELGLVTPLMKTEKLRPNGKRDFCGRII